jgi:hypothetical protein
LLQERIVLLDYQAGGRLRRRLLPLARLSLQNLACA